MVTNNNDNTTSASAAASTSTGLDLLFAASVLTSSRSSGADLLTRRSSMPVNNGEYSYTRHTVATAASNEEDVATKSVYNDGKLVDDSPAKPISKNFAQVLMDVLNTTHRDHASIIVWVPDGQSFLIAHQERFEKEILPVYFKGGSFNSFVRKLNRWGFRRIKSRAGRVSSFAHDLFLRDQPWLSSRMSCQSKPNFKKLKDDVDERQYTLLDAVTGASIISPCDDVHAPSSSSSGLLFSKNNITQSPTCMSMDELQKRELLISSISQTSEIERQLLLAQLQQQQRLPMDPQRYECSEVVAMSALKSSSMTHYSRGMLRGNNFCSEESKRTKYK